MYFVVEYTDESSPDMMRDKSFRLASVGKETQDEAREIAATLSHRAEGTSAKYFVCHAVEEVKAKPQPFDALNVDFIEV